MLQQHEEQFYSPEACIEPVLIPETGHVSNLQLNAADIYDQMLNWVDRRVGKGQQGPSEPCVSP